MYDTPLVSIVIPVYNGSNYLREAIESALSQTYKNIEVLVINDGSKDEGKTEAIANSFGNKIRYFFKTNGGVASALNMGIREMKGDYFSWLSHDDVYYHHKIATQIDTLKKYSTKTVLYADYDIIDENSALIGTERVPEFEPAALRYRLTVSHPIHGCTLLIPRSCLQQCGFFDERLRTTQDYDYWFRMADYCRFVHVPDRLIQSRHHLNQGTHTMLPLHYREVNELLGRFLEMLTPAELTAGSGAAPGLAYAMICENFITRKLYPSALAALGKSVRAFLFQSQNVQFLTVRLLAIQVFRLLRVLLLRLLLVGVQWRRTIP
jgi:glycosyltransferase involved in cell wall biosynthesis